MIIIKDIFELLINYKCKFSPPIDEDKIYCYEKEHGISIPQSYKNWLKYTNGGTLFKGYAVLYGINDLPTPSIGNDFSNGLVPKDYLILGYMESEHICYNIKKESFCFYEYEEPTCYFSDFKDVLNYIIDICTN